MRENRGRPTENVVKKMKYILESLVQVNQTTIQTR